MKKVLAVLIMLSLCAVYGAQTAPIDLTMNTTTVQEYGRYKDSRGHWQTGWHNVEKPVATTYNYLNVKEDGSLGTSGLTYTVTSSYDYGEVRGYDRQVAQVYFTTMSEIPADKVLAVQFLGAEVEYGTGNSYENTGFKVTDYGIYLYNPESGEMIGNYLSAKEYGNYFDSKLGVGAGTSFGVYYVDNDGNIVASTGDGMEKTNTGSMFHPKYEILPTENGQVGNFDDDSHILKVYDANGNVVDMTTDKHFLCLSAGEYGSDSFKISHWEFMLQTTLDDPYYPVNPNDFDTDVHIDDPIINPIGQPLPGVFATLLVAGAVISAKKRKLNK